MVYYIVPLYIWMFFYLCFVSYKAIPIESFPHEWETATEQLQYSDTQMSWFWTNQDTQNYQSTNYIALLQVPLQYNTLGFPLIRNRNNSSTSFECSLFGFCRNVIITHWL